MKKLIPGILFATLGIALLDGISGIITSSAAYIQTLIGCKAAERQIEINELLEKTSSDDEPIRAIGFSLDSCGEEDENYVG